MKSIPSSTKGISGFSLVEIALALGIVGFSLAALLGLLATAADSNADSSRETVMVSMTSQIMTDLRAVPFDALWDAKPRADVQSSAATTPNTNETIYYFTAEGARVDDSNALFDPSTVYLCTVTKIADLASQTPPQGRFNLLKLELAFTWPVSAPVANRQKHTIHASIARY